MDKEKFKKALGLMKEAFTSAQKFVDAKLNDGTTIVRYDAEKLDIGVPVMAVTEQGAIAMPDGDYTLEDGTMFSIAGGVVSVVTPVEEKAPEEGTAPAAASAATSNPAPAPNVKSIVESVIREQRFAEQLEEIKAELAEHKKLKENFATQKTESEKRVAELETEVSTQKKTLSQMFSLLEQMADEPSAKPAESNAKFDIKAWKKQYKEDLNRIEK